MNTLVRKQVNHSKPDNATRKRAMYEEVAIVLLIFKHHNCSLKRGKNDAL